ncbi:flagellar filament capping protein FliD [Desulfogranum japonicum]|uniref:flagellar filament capping protein FliD n=1 Tax=Desulfogranum japonicum TaxID=231447 RepID=UPI000402DDCF|nr:flagellar filament capping protein FliD [Desulfogranum japonicum]
MSITFSGLASGIDTASIVESIIEVESAPIETMESKQEYLETKLDAYTEFNTLLETFYSSALALNDESDLNTYDVTNNGSEYFSISTTSLANEGTYRVKVVSLAQQQKDISEDYIADTDTTLLTGELQIGEKTLTYENVTFDELVEMINEGDYGVSATIVDDGAEDEDGEAKGYRLMLTADTSGEAIELAGTGSITFDTDTNGHTIEGTQAHVVVDGVDYYASSNTMTNAIKGASITLMGESDSASNVKIESDIESNITTQLEELISAYNAINTYVDTIYDSDSTLANSMKTIQRSLRSYLTSSDLVSMGVESDWETGELSLDTNTLSEAYEADSEGVIAALIGDDENDGIMTRLNDFMDDQLDSGTGFLANKENSIDAEMERLDERIEAMEIRLEKRQETLQAQFSAMETLISSLNSQADYLTNFFEDYSSSS